MALPNTTKVGDLFWLNNEPIRITAWNYLYGPPHSYYFDIEFIEITKDGMPAAGMILIPMGFDFHGAEVREMTDVEKELF